MLCLSDKQEEKLLDILSYAGCPSWIIDFEIVADVLGDPLYQK